MATLLDLARKMDQLSGNIEKAANELKKELALLLVEELTRVTPVDTSKALSNWRANVQGRIEAAIEAHFLGSRGSTQAASISEAIAAAKAEIAGAKPGKPIAIFNSVPYIRRLNEGSSRQAPAGFVEASVLIARRKMRNKRLDIKRRR